MQTTKRDYRKFFTMPETADFMAGLLQPQGNDSILEPSAGNGALCKAVRAKAPGSLIIAVELYEEWETELRTCADVVFIQDFLTFNPDQRFTACVANPPFGNDTDLQAHFDKMCDLTIKGGNMVVLLPDDFRVKYAHKAYPLQNWGTNKDGTVTPIKVVAFRNKCYTGGGVGKKINTGGSVA